MSEWIEAKESAKRESQALGKVVKPYSYKDPKDAENTDMEIRRVAAKHIHGSRDIVFPMIESSYLEKEFKNVTALEDVMQWLEVFILEMELKLVWNSEAGYRQFRRLIKYDAELIRMAVKLESDVRKMMEGAKKGSGRKAVVKRCAEIKSGISDLMLVFKRRRHSLGG